MPHWSSACGAPQRGGARQPHGCGTVAHKSGCIPQEIANQAVASFDLRATGCANGRGTPVCPCILTPSNLLPPLEPCLPKPPGGFDTQVGTPHILRLGIGAAPRHGSQQAQSGLVQNHALTEMRRREQLHCKVSDNGELALPDGRASPSRLPLKSFGLSWPPSGPETEKCC